MTSRWAAVIVNYEAGSLLSECVASVLADDSAGAPELVVVDNGSKDGSVATLRSRFPSVTIVDPARNLGYASAANRGTAATRADVVVVLNADVHIEPGTAKAMLDRFDADAALGALGPIVHDPDGSVYPSARALPSLVDAVGHGLLGLVWARNPFSRRYRQLDADPHVARDVDWVSGAAIWLRREALDTVGGWDEGYFMYVEDVDLCWRLRRIGWRVAYEPAGSIVHVQGASTATMPYRMILEHHRSLARFAGKRWHGVRRVLLAPAAVYLAVRAVVAMAAHALATRPGKAHLSK